MKEVRGAFVRATSVDAHKEGVHRDDDALGQVRMCLDQCVSHKCLVFFWGNTPVNCVLSMAQVKLNELMGLEQKLSTALQLVGGLTTTR